MERPGERFTDANERLRAMGRLMLRADSYEPVAGKDETESYDAKGHEQTWDDMMRLQDEGDYPAGFASIRSRVIMMHGSHDPHPGRMILESLKRYIPQIEYRQWEKCGHYPWLEKAVRGEFYGELKEWLKVGN